MGDYRLAEKAEAKLAEIYAYSLLNFGERQADAYI
jgi:plasmid stabilization system protein ParE